jgi:8-oxo-dGTP pyrophosphatase MutT (NUDIX family)
MTPSANQDAAAERRRRALTRQQIVECLRRDPVPPAEEDLHLSPVPPGARVTLAAVLVPLVSRDGNINVLLTQRSAHLRDHPNQISFPGGRVEGGDENRIDTALREAAEETGLARESVEVLGMLPEHEMSSGFRISPVVGWIEPPFDLTLDPFEVAAAFEVPLAHFLDPANHLRRHFYFNGRHRHYLAMPYDGRFIWGATAGMLYSLYRQLTAC